MTDRPSLKMNWLEKLLWAMHMHELAWWVRDERYAWQRLSDLSF